MTVLGRKLIKEMCENIDRPLMTPFHVSSEKSGDKKVPSFGLSLCGYDVRLADEYKLAKQNDEVFRLVSEDDGFEYHKSEDGKIILPPYGFMLGRTVEYFKMPNDVMGSLFCKSTYARIGLNMPPTIIEPGWEGNLVVEIFNMRPQAVEIDLSGGIGQVVFFKVDNEQEALSYSGKYQGQMGVQSALLGKQKE